MRVYLVNLDITAQEKTAGFSCSHNALKKIFLQQRIRKTCTYVLVNVEHFGF